MCKDYLQDSFFFAGKAAVSVPLLLEEGSVGLKRERQNDSYYDDEYNGENFASALCRIELIN